MGRGRDRKERRARIAAKAWPAAVGGGFVAWYAADSLRHRREGGHGYELRGDVSVGDPRFMRDGEALTGAPVSEGNDVELLVNGDQIFPEYLGAIRDARETVNLLTYAYWRGEIAVEVADALCVKAGEGVECNVLIDAVGGAKMDRKLVTKMREAG
jgi:cardiolipin synthase